MDAARNRETIFNIYETVADPSCWTRVLNDLSKEFGALGCMIFEWQSHGSERLLEAPLITSSYEREVMDDYIREFSAYESYDQDRFEKASLDRDGIELVNEHNFVISESTYLAQPNVQWMLERGIRHRFGCLLDKDNTFRHRFAIQSSEAKGLFTENEVADLEALLPHIAKALDLCGSLRAGRFARNALLSVIEKFDVGVCVLDAKGREFHANTEFHRQQEKFSAFTKNKFKSDRLYLNRQNGRKQFEALLEDVLNHGIFGARPRKEAIIVDSHDDHGALCVEVTPLNRLAENGTAPLKGAMLISRDTSKPINIDWRLANEALRLTDTESDVADLVCQGNTNSEIADRRGKSVETVNVQVKQILNKSRVKNRTQLMRLMCNFVTAPALVP